MPKRAPAGRAAPATPAPRYQRIAAQLIAEIRRGRYAVGAQLPTEHALCARFGASRYTVQAAMRELTARGLVSRRPRAGSIVIAAEQPELFTQSVGAITQLLDYPEPTYREVHEAGPVAADGILAELLRCEPGMRWFRIRAWRRRPGIELPICWTDVYILPEYASVVKRRDHGTLPVFRQIEADHGVRVAHAKLDIFAAGVPARLARPLQVKPGSPALTIVRRYYAAGGSNFENTVSIHPGERFTYSIDLRRELRGNHPEIR